MMGTYNLPLVGSSFVNIANNKMLRRSPLCQLIVKWMTKRDCTSTAGIRTPCSTYSSSASDEWGFFLRCPGTPSTVLVTAERCIFCTHPYLSQCCNKERVMLSSQPHPASCKASVMATAVGLVMPLEQVVFCYGFLRSWQVCLSKDWLVIWMDSGVMFAQEVLSIPSS